MSDPVPALVLDLLESLAAGPRPYRDVIDAWRTSCPRLPVWETASDEGLIAHGETSDGEAVVSLSPKGRAHLLAKRPTARVRVPLE
jgi:hypothetical protein